MCLFLAVVIPFYNEEAENLLATLLDLNKNFKELRRFPSWKNRPLDVVCVGDGWLKMSDSMKELLKTFFPCWQGNFIKYVTVKCVFFRSNSKPQHIHLKKDWFDLYCLARSTLLEFSTTLKIR